MRWRGAPPAFEAAAADADWGVVRSAGLGTLRGRTSRSSSRPTAAESAGKTLNGGGPCAPAMQLRLLEKEKNSLRVEVSNPDETVLYPLITALLKHEDVSDARYFTGHPQLDKPVLTIVTKKGNPQTILKKVAEDLASEYASAKQLLEKELK